MSELKMRDGIKPFCPVHHWRMAFDAGSRVSQSYRCSYEKCDVRFAPSQGYFEVGQQASVVFPAALEAIPCERDPNHHPCIVGYAKDSHGNQTEEWRHWQCLAEGCAFSLRQKLLPSEALTPTVQARKNSATKAMRIL
jgi:hypothetical protein